MSSTVETLPTLREYIKSFLIDRRANNLTPKTIRFYHDYLEQFAAYCDAQNTYSVESLTSDFIRAYLVEYAKTHNAGGCHALYRTVRAFLKWYETEYEPHAYRNPINKVKSPKVPTDPLAPVELTDVSLLLKTCKGTKKLEKRDTAIILTLIDTGVRANELLSIVMDDINLSTGEIRIKRGKGGKPRTVFAGHRTRKAIRSYVKTRRDGFLFQSRSKDKMDITGLRAIIQRRAKDAAIAAPSLHAFRRGFAINCLRSGMDIFSLQRLMGHSDLGVLRRYLNQTNEDLQTAHNLSSPADKLI